MKKLIIITLAILLSGCSANYHLKRSRHHIRKAELKGYNFEQDTIKKITKLPIIPLRISDSKRLLIIDSINTILLKDSCLNAVNSGSIQRYIDSVLVRVPIEIDTTFNLENGGQARVWSVNGQLMANFDNVCVEQKPIFIEKKLKWSDYAWIFLTGLGIVFIIVIVITFVVRRGRI